MSEAVRPAGSLPGRRGRGAEWGTQGLLRLWCRGRAPGAGSDVVGSPTVGWGKGEAPEVGEGPGAGFGGERPISICSVFPRKRRAVEKEQRLAQTYNRVLMPQE